MKVGDIALFNNRTLCRITRIEKKEVPITKTVKTGWFSSKKEDTGRTKTKLERVWWCPIGEEWKGKETSNVFSASYDWDDMISGAKFIIKQVELLKQLEKSE